MIITTHAVTSSQIKEIGYDEPSKTMAILFHSGGLYHYTGVSHEDWIDFASAESIGSHFYKNIKCNPARFPYTRK